MTTRQANNNVHYNLGEPLFSHESYIFALNGFWNWCLL